MRSRYVLALIASAQSAGLGCVTVPALFDLVVPNPIARVSIDRGSSEGELRWKATYGREPEDLWEYPIHLWVDRTGKLGVPLSSATCQPFVAHTTGELEHIDGEKVLASEHGRRYGPPNDLSRSSAPKSRCAHVVATAESDIDRIVVFDLDGNMIHQEPLPRDIPIARAERRSWAFIAPFLDVLLPPLLLWVGARSYCESSELASICSWFGL